MVTAIGGAHHAPRFASVASTMPRNVRAAAAGSGASDNAEMTATPSAPAAITSAALLASTPAMPQTGSFALRRFNTLDDARQPGGPDRRFLLLFRQRDIDAARADIVDQIDRRGFGFGHRFDRQADDRAGPAKPPRIRDRHVVRPEMHAVGAGGERHIDAIVDDEGDAERRQRFFDRSRRLDHGAGFAVLVAQLNERRAALRAQAAPVRRDRGRRRVRDRQWRSGEDRTVIADLQMRAQSRAVETVKRIDDGGGEAAGPARVRAPRLHRRRRTPSARRWSQARRSRLDRKRRADQRRAGAAHGGDKTHQRIAVRDRHAARAVGHNIDAAGERDDGAHGPCAKRAGASSAASSPDSAANSAWLRRTTDGLRPTSSRANSRARRRAFDEDRVEEPGHARVRPRRPAPPRSRICARHRRCRD